MDRHAELCRVLAVLAAILLSPAMLAFAPAPAAGSLPVSTDSFSIDSDIETVIDAEPPTRALANATTWTVALYMSADNNLSPYAALDRDEILDAGVPPWLSVAILFDGAASDDTRLSVVEGNAETTVPSFGSPEMDLSEPETLAMFINWTRENLPSERLCLCLWGHASGWRGLLTDKGEMMSLPDLGSALAWGSIQYMAVDLLVLDTCSMATYETAVEVAPHATYLVASEMEIPDFGMPYDVLVGTIAENPAVAPEALGQAVCEGYIDVSRLRSQYSVSISLVWLVPFRNSGLMEDARSFARDVLRWTPGANEGIWEARAGAEHYQNGGAYDLGDLLDNIIADDSLIMLRDSADWFRRCYASSILYHERLDHSAPKDGVHVRRSTGLVLQFYWGSIPSEYRGLRLSQMTSWDEATDALSLVDDPRTLSITNATYDVGARITIFSSNVSLPCGVVLFQESGTPLASAGSLAALDGDDVVTIPVPRPEWVIAVASVFEGNRTTLLSVSPRFWAWGERDDVTISDVAVYRADGTSITTSSLYIGCFSSGGVCAIEGQPTTFTVTLATMHEETPVTVRVHLGNETVTSWETMAAPGGVESTVQIELPGGYYQPLAVSVKVPYTFPDSAKPNLWERYISVASATPSKSLVVRVAIAGERGAEAPYVMVENARTGEVLAQGYALDGELAFTIGPGEYMEGDTLVASSAYSVANGMAYSQDGSLELVLASSGEAPSQTLLVILYVAISVSVLAMAALARSMHARHHD